MMARRVGCLVSGVLVMLTVVSEARAGAWTLPAGEVWIKSGVHYQFTRDLFAAEPATLPGGTQIEVGDRRPFDDEGASRVRLIWSEFELGVTDRWTVGAQVPWYDLRFEDRVQRVDSWGIGDLRFTSRFALLTGSDRVSVRAVWKLPQGEAATDPDDVPVSEGQTDLELGLQWGRSLGRPSAWIGVEAARRWRAENTDENRDPGDEWLWHFEAGWPLDRDGHRAVKVGYDGLAGERVLFTDSDLLGGQRRFHAASLAFLFAVSAWNVEVGASTTWAGESYPAGTMWSGSLSRSLELW